MAKLKICGLKRVEDIDYVNELKVDYIGFILSDGYKRSIDFETAQSLKNRLSKDIKAVGVFVDEDKKYIDYYIKNNIIDIVQLHGNEEPEFCKGFDVPVIKCFNPDTFSKVDEYARIISFSIPVRERVRSLIGAFCLNVKSRFSLQAE